MGVRHINVTAYLLEGKSPDRIALSLVDGDHSYGELQLAVEQVAGFLSDTAAQKGDRLILIAENSLFWVAAYLGSLRAGLACVPLPASITAPDLTYILRTTSAQIAFVQTGPFCRNRECFRGLDIVTDRDMPSAAGPVSQRTFGELLQRDRNSRRALPVVHPDDLAALMFTSGSTGRPRGVMVSHRNIMANTESIIQFLNLTQDDRIMDVLPFHYCFGASLLHTHLRVGGSLVVERCFMYPESVFRRMLQFQCTGFAGVPSHFQILLRNSGLWKKQFPSLRYVQQAGGHLAPAFITELRHALPTTQIYIMYGQTEATARLSYLPPEFLSTKLGSIGKGIPGVKLRVLNDSGGEVRPGEVGEIVAEGENITLGYWCAPLDTAGAFKEGSLHTGDMATVDEDGFIYIVDRAGDFLKCGGKRISCRQLEDELLTFGDLLEAAIVGVPDDVLGETAKAFVVPRDIHSVGLEERLRLFCRARLAPQLVPRDFVVLPALPKNNAGKVLKQDLKKIGAAAG